MQVILMRDVRHTGRRGEIVEVKPGYARNYLVPRGLALKATPGNIKVFEQQKHKIEIHHEKERDAAAAVAAELAGLSLEIRKRVGETETLYGSVTATDVTEALEAKGVSVDRRRIDLEGGIKTLGEHPVRIELHSEVTAEIIVQVLPEE
ncbi:MAG: 50S ribosomal protein L9 [Acidobacteriota bacterium]|nr:50S ribosomal protein L9 [Acidobacteriota bacterium]